MKQLIALLMALFSFSTSNSQTSIYDIAINDISGKAIDLGAFKGKYILFVNVASECGFTPQYAGLEEIHQFYKDNLVVIGLPCNQFGGQEPAAGGHREECQGRPGDRDRDRRGTGRRIHRLGHPSVSATTAQTEEASLELGRQRRLDIEGRGDQHFGVGFLWRIENTIRRTLLDDLALTHDDDLIGQRPHDFEVVADKQVGELVALLQVAQEIDNLRLNRHVER